MELKAKIYFLKVLSIGFSAALFFCIFFPGKAFADNFKKAEMIVKFTDFIEWPDNDEYFFTIGIVGDQKLLKIMDKIKPDKIKGRKLIITDLKNNFIKPPHILYIGRPTLSQWIKIKKNSDLKNTLTISSSEIFLKQGGIISFYIKKNKSLGFSVNRNAQLHSGLKFSSHLLKLADIKVYSAGETQ